MTVQGSRVDFSYAFGRPHRMTAALPDSSDKTLLDVQQDILWMGWSYEDLRHAPLAALMPPKTTWSMSIWPEVDGKRLPRGAYGRGDGNLPVLDLAFKDAQGTVKFAKKASMPSAILHVRLPKGMKVKSVDSGSGAKVTADGEGILWSKPTGAVKFIAEVGYATK